MTTAASLLNFTMMAMNHTGHVMDSTMSPMMNHTGHDMNSTMDHTGHDMNNTMSPMMNHSGHDMNNTMDHNLQGHGMAMYFTLGHDLTSLFFEKWSSNSGRDLAGMIVFLFVLSVLYEGLKVGRQVILTNAVFRRRKSYSSPARNLSEARVREPHSVGICSSVHFLQTFLHMVQVFVGYLLMLAFMTYNTWLCLAVIVGSGLGYFLFGWKTATIVNSSGDHCN